MPSGRRSSPLVSVLIPAYNHEKYVARTLDSIAAETHRPLEVLVCDDGSTDGTRSVIEHWIDAHPELDAHMMRQANAGIAKSLNRLLAEAHGEYVVPLASDDELIPGGISRRLEALGSGVHAVFGDANVIDSQDELLAPSALRWAGSSIGRLLHDPAAEIISRWTVPGPVLLVEKTALRDLGGWSEDLIVEDWDLYLRLAAKGWIRYADTVVARYRIHGGNVVRDQAKRKRVLRDHRRVATRNARLFTGRKAFALRLQRIRYTSWISDTQYSLGDLLPGS